MLDAILFFYQKFPQTIFQNIIYQLNLTQQEILNIINHKKIKNNMPILYYLPISINLIYQYFPYNAPNIFPPKKEHNKYIIAGLLEHNDTNIKQDIDAIYLVDPEKIHKNTIKYLLEYWELKEEEITTLVAYSLIWDSSIAEKWMINPDEKFLFYAKNNLKSIKFLVENGILLERQPELILHTIKNKNNHIYEYLFRKNLGNSVKYFIYAIEQDNLYVIQKLIDYLFGGWHRLVSLSETNFYYDIIVSKLIDKKYNHLLANSF